MIAVLYPTREWMVFPKNESQKFGLSITKAASSCQKIWSNTFLKLIKTCQNRFSKNLVRPVWGTGSNVKACTCKKWFALMEEGPALTINQHD